MDNKLIKAGIIVAILFFISYFILKFDLIGSLFISIVGPIVIGLLFVIGMNLYKNMNNSINNNNKLIDFPKETDQNVNNSINISDKIVNPGPIYDYNNSYYQDKIDEVLNFMENSPIGSSGDPVGAIVTKISNTVDKYKNLDSNFWFLLIDELLSDPYKNNDVIIMKFVEKLQQNNSNFVESEINNVKSLTYPNIKFNNIIELLVVGMPSDILKLYINYSIKIKNKNKLMTFIANNNDIDNDDKQILFNLLQ